MPPIRDLMLCVVMPMVLGAVLGALVPKRGDRPAAASRLTVIGFACIAAGACLLVNGWPEEDWQRMAWVPLAAIVGCLLVAYVPGAVGTTIGCVVAAAATQAVLWPIVDTEPLAIRVAPFVLTLVAGLLIESMAPRPLPFGGILVLVVPLSGASIAALLYGFASAALPAASLPAAIGTCALVLALRSARLGAGLGPIAGAWIVTCAGIAWIYQVQPGDAVTYVARTTMASTPPVVPILLLCLAPLVFVRASAKTPFARGWLVRTALAIVIAAGAGGLIHWGSMPPTADGVDGEGGPGDDPLDAMYREMYGG